MERDEQDINFDKFMDDILIKESKKKQELVEETPQRKYAKKYTERASNRIRFSKVL